MSNLSNISITHTFNGDLTANNKVDAAELDTQLGNLATAQNETKAALDVITDGNNNLAAATVGFAQLKGEVAVLIGEATTPVTLTSTGSSMGLEVIGNIAAYFEINVQNQSGAAGESSDLVATASNGSATTHYVDTGINGPNGGAAPFTGANSAYSYTTDADYNFGAGILTGTATFKWWGGVTPTLFATLDSTGLLSQGAVLSNSPSGGVGYSTGAGGTVSQTGSRTTQVTIDKVSGNIVLVSAAGSTTPASFTVNNSRVAITDTIVLSQRSGADKYVLLVTNVANGSFVITAYTTGGTTVELPIINFTVIKGVAA